MDGRPTRYNIGIGDMKKMRYGELTGKILEILVGLTATSFELLEAMLEAGYGASYFQLQRKLSEVQGRKREEGFKRARRNFYRYLYKLEKDKLIARKGQGWTTTKTGERKYKDILKRLLLRKREYKCEPDSTIKLVMFDIPEKQRAKRQWLRETLRELNFKPLQKSVWMGKVKLPKSFIEDLESLDLLDYVEVLAVTKTGSLRVLA